MIERNKGLVSQVGNVDVLKIAGDHPARLAMKMRLRWMWKREKREWEMAQSRVVGGH
jgi:hypothetical protein